MPLWNHLACLPSVASVVEFRYLKLQWCLFPRSEVDTTNLMINSISGMDTYSLFYIKLEVHIVLAGINVCASFLSEFPQKRQLYFKSNTVDTVWNVEGPHSEADCSRLRFLRVCFMCFSERYLRLKSICTNFTNCCYHNSVTALFGNEKVLFGKSRDSLQNMYKSIMVSLCVWLQVSNTPFKN